MQPKKQRIVQVFTLFCVLAFGLMYSQPAFSTPPPEDSLSTSKKSLVLLETIRGKLSPKSVVIVPNRGLFFAQNMMYRHTVSVYNREFNLVGTIPDKVDLNKFGFKNYGKNSYRGAPVEADFSHNGRFIWISNYQMYGDSTTNPGCDGCATSSNYDKSFVYKIATDSLRIEQIVEVGAVPKYLQVTPDNRYVLVSNWSSGDVSIISTASNTVIKTVKLGRYPRGIAISSTSSYAFVALMGSDRIAKIDLTTFDVSWIKDVGRAPRHLCIDSNNRFLYATINNENKVVKIDLASNTVVASVKTGSAPRSMVLTPNNRYLYVVNYFSNKLSRVSTETMAVEEHVSTDSKPIGVTFDPESQNVWVACYSGSLMVFNETAPDAGGYGQPLFAYNLVKNYAYNGTTSYRKSCFAPEEFVRYSGEELLPPPPANSVVVVEAIPQATPTVVKVETTALAVNTPAKEKASPPVVVKEERMPAPIKKEVKPAAPQPIAAAPQPVHRFFIIGGSFKVKNNADRLAAKLREEGYPDAIAIPRVGKTYLVSYGGASNATDANQLLANVKKLENSSAWIWQR